MTITEHRCVTDDENPNIFSACHSATLSEEIYRPDRIEATILAAWSVLLRDYYAPHSPTFIHLQARKGIPSEKTGKVTSECLRSQQLSISVDESITGGQLEDAASQAIDTSDWDDLESTKEKTAVLVLSNEQIKYPPKVLELLEV
jgi:hypothetical protein